MNVSLADVRYAAVFVLFSLLPGINAVPNPARFLTSTKCRFVVNPQGSMVQSSALKEHL